MSDPTATAGSPERGSAPATAARCACRPSCLSVLRKADVTIPTAAGPALALHLHPAASYSVAGLTSLTSPLSKVRGI